MALTESKQRRSWILKQQGWGTRDLLAPPPERRKLQPPKEPSRWEVVIGYGVSPVLFRGKTYDVPIEVEDILKSTEALNVIDQLEENWNDEGSVPIPKEVIDTSAAMLFSYASWLCEMHSAKLPVPNITPLKNGSIDLYWKSTERHFLFNIYKDKASGKVAVDFFAQEFGDEHMEGPVRADRVNETLAFFMKELK